MNTSFLGTLSVSLLGLSLSVACNPDKDPDVDPDRSNKSITVFIGTYTRGWACPTAETDGDPCTSKGIYRAQLDPKTGSLTQPVLAADSDNPSYLAISPNGKNLYAVNEVDDFQGQKSGAITAYAIEASGALRQLNQLSSHGADPCHVSLTSNGRAVLVANYSGGNVSSYKVGPGGELIDASTVANAGEHGPHMNQDAAHAHFIAEGATTGLAYVADLGLDRIFLYDVDPDTAVLKPHAAQPSVVVAPAGSGPRHIAFHPAKKYLYTNNELGTTASTFARDNLTGALTVPALQNLSTIPLPFGEHSDNGEIQIDREGHFVYVSNRGHDSLTTFSVHASNGTLTFVENVPSGGKEPRDFKIEPNGKFLLAAHQNSDEIFTFAIDPNSGKLARLAGNPIKMSKPVNFAFWQGEKK